MKNIELKSIEPVLILNNEGTFEVIKTNDPITNESHCQPLPNLPKENLVAPALGFVNNRLWACGGRTSSSDHHKECYTFDVKVSVLTVCYLQYNIQFSNYRIINGIWLQPI